MSIISRKRRTEDGLTSLIQQQNNFDESLLALVADKSNDRLPSSPRVVRRRTNTSQAATVRRSELETTTCSETASTNQIRTGQHKPALEEVATSPENLFHRHFGPVDATLDRRTGAFGTYQLGKRLAQGAFGIVYRARNTEGGQRLAVKLVSKKAYAGDEEACTALKREVDLLMFVKHINVVGCEDVLHGASHIGLVTQLCYKDLRDYAARRVPLLRATNNQESSHSWEFVRHVSKALFSGLSYLHSNGIIHLDIKPENILVKRKASPEELTWEDFCLCDFGMSQRADDDDGQPETTVIIPNKPCGTPGFVAPELYSSPGVYDGRAADMFSAGVTLIDLVYGLSPEWDEAYRVLSYDVESGMDYLSEQISVFATAKWKGSDELHDLACGLVEAYPPQRLSAVAALHHPSVSEIADD